LREGIREPETGACQNRHRQIGAPIDGAGHGRLGQHDDIRLGPCDLTQPVGDATSQHRAPCLRQGMFRHWADTRSLYRFSAAEHGWVTEASRSHFETALAQAERLGMALHLSALTDGAHLGHRDVLWWVPI